MARKRDWKKEHVRKNEIALAKGYKSAWDYRIHGYGKRQPGAPAFTGAEREQLAGRRGKNRLYAHLEEGRVEQINLNAAKYGKNPVFDVQVVLDDGSTEEYKLRGRDQIDHFFDIYDEFPDADAPDLVGSPKAIAAARG